MFFPQNSALLIVDIQERLADLMESKAQLTKNVSILIQASEQLNIPIIYTEQVPEKIGKTISAIAQYLEKYRVIEKRCFSCYGEGTFVERLEAVSRKQIVITGIETHVCIYQTVCDLMDKNYEVQVIEDAVSSRSIANKKAALKKIEKKGAEITTTEMIIFEWLKTAEHEKFHEISKLIR